MYRSPKSSGCRLWLPTQNTNSEGEVSHMKIVRVDNIENVKRAWWQSRLTTGGKVAPVPELTDIRNLALLIRKGWSHDTP